jgi:hypothetical protein
MLGEIDLKRKSCLVPLLVLAVVFVQAPMKASSWPPTEDCFGEARFNHKHPGQIKISVECSVEGSMKISFAPAGKSSMSQVLEYSPMLRASGPGARGNGSCSRVNYILCTNTGDGLTRFHTWVKVQPKMRCIRWWIKLSESVSKRKGDAAEGKASARIAGPGRLVFEGRPTNCARPV